MHLFRMKDQDMDRSKMIKANIYNPFRSVYFFKEVNFTICCHLNIKT